MRSSLLSAQAHTLLLICVVLLGAGCGGNQAPAADIGPSHDSTVTDQLLNQVPSFVDLPRSGSDIRTLDPALPAEVDGEPLMSAGVSLGYPTTAQPGESGFEWVIYQCDPIGPGVQAQGVRMGLAHSTGSVWLGVADYTKGVWEWQELTDFTGFKVTAWLTDQNFREDGVTFIAFVVMPGSYLELSELDLMTLYETDLPPEVLGVGPLEFTMGQEVRLQAEYSGSRPLSFAWDFGNHAVPTHSSVVQPLVTYSQAGSYDCSLTLSNSYGDSTFPFTVNVLHADIPPEIVGIWPAGGAPGQEIQIEPRLAGGKPLTWHWEFGAGAVPGLSFDEAPVVVLSTLGDYDCSLTVGNEFGTDNYSFVLHVGTMFVDDDGNQENDPADIGVTGIVGNGVFMVELSFMVQGMIPIQEFWFDPDFTPPAENFMAGYDLANDPGWCIVDNGDGTYTATGPVLQAEGHYTFAIKVVDSTDESAVYWWPEKVLLESPSIFKESWEDGVQPGTASSQWQLDGAKGVLSHDWINTDSNRVLTGGALGSARFARFDSEDFGGDRWQYGNGVSRTILTGPHTCQSGQDYSIILSTSGYSEGYMYDYLTIDYSWNGVKWFPITDGATNYLGSYRFGSETLGDAGWLIHQQNATAASDEFYLRAEFISDDNSDGYDGPCLDEIKVIPAT